MDVKLESKIDKLREELARAEYARYSHPDYHMQLLPKLVGQAVMEKLLWITPVKGGYRFAFSDSIHEVMGCATDESSWLDGRFRMVKEDGFHANIDSDKIAWYLVYGKCHYLS